MSNLVKSYNEFHPPEFPAKRIFVGMKLKVIKSEFNTLLEKDYVPISGDIVIVTDLNLNSACIDEDNEDSECYKTCQCDHIPFLYTIIGHESEGEHIACYATFETLDGKKVV